MRISEIISEAPGAGAIGTAVGRTAGTALKGIGAVAGGVTAVPKRIVKGVRAGADAFNKLISPSQWFGSSGQPDKDDTDTDKVNDTDPSAASLQSAISGSKLQQTDIENLKKLYNTTGNSDERAALQAVFDQKPLDAAQIQNLKNLSYRL